MHLAEIRSNKMQTFNLSSPEGYTLKPNSTLTLLDYRGAGEIKRLHLTNYWHDPLFPRKTLLKIYWDDEEIPSIMCPVGDFFCDPFCGTGLKFATQYFGNHGKHWYCYLPMPFSKRCRIEIENQSNIEDECVAYDVTLEKWDKCSENLGRLHTCWQRENPTTSGKAYSILDINGKGHFIGCNLSVQSLDQPSLSFLEGLSYIFVNKGKKPALKVWGTEDFLGGSFYFGDGLYAGPYSGCTYKNENLGRFAGYRFFIEDAIPFDSHIHVLVNHGEYFKSGPFATYTGRADYSSIAYWYQLEPHETSCYQGQSVIERLPLINIAGKKNKV